MSTSLDENPFLQNGRSHRQPDRNGLPDMIFSLATKNVIVAQVLGLWRSGQCTSYESCLSQMVVALARQNEDLMKAAYRLAVTSPPALIVEKPHEV